MKFFSKKTMLILSMAAVCAAFTSCSSDDDGPAGGSTQYNDNTQLWPAYDSSNSGWGYINREGKMVIPGQFSEAEAFSCGLALVSVNGKDLFVDTNGSIKSGTAQFDSAEDFQNNYAVVRKGSTYGMINTSLDYVLQPIYYSLGEVSTNGLIAYKMSGGAKYGYMNVNGEIVIQPMYDYAGEFVDGVAVVGISGSGSSTKYGLINASGNYVVNPMYDELSSLYNNRLSFRKQADSSYDHTYGMLDTSGKQILPQIYDYIRSDKHLSGKFAVENEQDKYGYIDVEGKTVIPFTYKYADRFSEGYAFAELESDVAVVIDGNGNVKTTLEEGWRPEEEFHNGLALIYKYDRSGYSYTYRYIDYSGKVVYTWTE